MKQLLITTLTDPQARYYFVVTDILAFVTIVSVLGIVLETVPALQAYQPLFTAIEWVAVVVFTLEYAARLYSTRPWHRYSFSFFGVVDFLAIVPTFLGLGNLTFLKTARVLRILRLLRMVRLVKLSRIPADELEESLGIFALNVGIYVVLLMTSLLVFGTALYITEIQDAFASIPAAMWWSFKVFLGSLPVTEPLSVFGEVLYVLARFTGLILLGVLVGVVGNIFRATLLGKKK